MAGLTSTSNLESLSQIAAELTHKFKDGFVKVFNEENDLWQWIPKRRATGEAVRVKFHIGRNSGTERQSETGSIGDADHQTYRSGYEDFAIYTAAVEVTDLAQAKAAVAGHGNYEAWAEETARAAEDLARFINKDLWGKAADASNHCLGILDALDQDGTPSSYWGLSRAAYPFLKCIYIDHQDGGQNQTLSLGVLRELFRKIQHGTGSDLVGTGDGAVTFAAADQGGGRPRILVTTPEIEQAYEALITQNNRFPIPPARNTGVDPGLGELEYKGAGFVGSRFCPDYNLFALDLRTWAIEILPQVLVDAKGNRSETDFAFVLHGRDGQSVKAFWRIYYQLVCEKPWRNGRITGISHDEPSA
jgi:hypothetical protein